MVLLFAKADEITKVSESVIDAIVIGVPSGVPSAVVIPAAKILSPLPNPLVEATSTLVPVVKLLFVLVVRFLV